MMKQFFMKSERICPLFIDILMDIIYYLYMILFIIISALNNVKINAMPLKLSYITYIICIIM